MYPLWDETTVAVWLDPALISREKTLLVDVDTNFTANYGTIESWPSGQAPIGPSSQYVVFGVDAPQISKLVVRLLSAAEPIAMHFPRKRPH